MKMNTALFAIIAVGTMLLTTGAALAGGAGYFTDYGGAGYFDGQEGDHFTGSADHYTGGAADYHTSAPAATAGGGAAGGGYAASFGSVNP
ncbi:MAG: hypothetical protein QXF55_00565, partial [Candidatus Aenigmatarchaeota archaeon]